ncbi:MAG TPA: tetratricopeptide repeat protein [Salinibacter sp.]|nr:tetratricopeptide repeat protein [Salinibacter sp.]
MAVPDLQDAINHLQQKDVDGAIATLERKIDELPAHLTAHVLLARAYEAKHQWDRALTCWENVYFLMPNSPVAREGKRRVFRHMDGGEDVDEIEEVTPSVARSPEARDADAPSDATAAEAPAEDAAEEGPPTTAPEAVSELEKLRQKAEKEARQGGARSELGSSPGPAPGTPKERVDELEDAGDDDLDQLIDELESARIEPDPDVDDAPAPDLENDVDDIVSETLARIHEAQDQYRKAAQIYVKLASQEPDRAREFLEKAAEMRKKAEQQSDEGDT